jgi:y4mF family transcriptional regulator
VKRTSKLWVDFFPIGKKTLDIFYLRSNYPERENTCKRGLAPMKISRSGKSHPDVERMAFAIRARRRAAGLTQTELAGLAGTSLRFISELERAKPTVQLEKVLEVLATLGLQIRIFDAGGEIAQ